MRSGILIFPFFALILTSPQADPEKQFLKGFEDVNKFIQREHWDTAYKKLRVLIEAHPNRPYVLAKKKEIRGCMATCVFRKDYKLPEYKDLVSGELLSYKAYSGAIKLKYTKRTSLDFQRTEKEIPIDSKYIYMLPAHFIGPHTLEFKGPDFPIIMTYGKAPHVFMCYTDQTHYAVNLSINPWIGRWNGLVYEDQTDGEMTSFLNKKSFHLKVSATKSEIIVYLNKKCVSRLKRPKSEHGRYGCCRYSKLPYKELTISGKVDPSWLEGRKEERGKEARAAFDKAYKPEDYLPSWLLGE